MWSETVTSPDAVIPALMAAIDKAMSQKTATHLSIPVDIFTAVPPVLGPINPAYAVVESSAIDQEMAQQTLLTSLGLLKSSQNPILLLGEPTKTLDVPALDLAQRLGAEIIVAAHVRGIVDETSPKVLGGIGPAYIPPWWQEVDGIVLIGTCPYELDFLPTATTIIQIAKNCEDIYHDRVSHALVGDHQSIVAALAERIPPKTYDSPWLLKILEEKSSQRRRISAEATNLQTPISPTLLMAELNRCCADDAIICLDIGSFIHGLGRALKLSSRECSYPAIGAVWAPPSPVPSPQRLHRHLSK